jgi:hypothetical protein
MGKPSEIPSGKSLSLSQRLKETKLTDLAYAALPIETPDVNRRLKQAAIAKVEGHGAYH